MKLSFPTTNFIIQSLDDNPCSFKFKLKKGERATPGFNISISLKSDDNRDLTEECKTPIDIAAITSIFDSGKLAASQRELALIHNYGTAPTPSTQTDSPSVHLHELEREAMSQMGSVHHVPTKRTDVHDFLQRNVAESRYNMGLPAGELSDESEFNEGGHAAIPVTDDESLGTPVPEDELIGSDSPRNFLFQGNSN